MAQKTTIPDRTAIVPFVLFGILAAVVTYSIIKGTRRGTSVRMKEDVLYVKPYSWSPSSDADSTSKLE